ncbi:MAG TPA: polysaccharide biosynthesis/export family protein [Pyrinomonadaceae bacterium]|nr:polysaccharide biosynthesis/export family protein [Pyrinomonadaceae bacterium]
MKAVTSFFLLIVVCFGAAALARAQEQSPGAAQTSASVQPVSADSQGITKYLLGPGDTLDIRVYGQSDLNSVVDVDSDGNIIVPFVEKPIPARCRTDREVTKDLIAAYSKYLKNPQVSVRITARNSRQPAVVFGAVRMPQRVLMQRKVLLNEVLAVTGGFTERASGTIQVLHTEPMMCPEPGEVIEQAVTDDGLRIPFEVYRIADLKAGKKEANPVIRPGDIVIVQEGDPVYVTGSVVSPQGVYLRDQMTLGRALAMVGGIRKEAKSSEVHIYRQKPGSTEQEVIKVNYDAIKRKKQPDVALQPFDVIDVPEASAFSGKRIGQTILSGALGIPGSAMTQFGTYLPLKVIY